MNKKLLAVAVAGAFLAAPVAAFAQSSVTISGLFKVSFGQLKIGNYNPPFSNRSALGTNSSETRVTDDSSRIVFNVVEDLGGGLQAIGQVDWRIALDSGAAGTATSTFGPGGNNHVGLRNKSWGRIFVGQQDLHYFNRESELTSYGDLKADSIGLLAYIQGQAIAAASRTRNVVHYTTPNWGGFTVIAAYSTNPNPVSGTGLTENDINSVSRKGKGWNLNPNFAGSNWQVGYSYWSSKADNPTAAQAALSTATGAGAPFAFGAAGVTGTINAAIAATLGSSDQRSDRLYGSYRWGGFKLGLAWDKSRLNTAVANATLGLASGTKVADRTAWSLPMQYKWGSHGIYAHLTKARNDKAAVNAGLNTKADMFAIAYAYELSKRTSAAVTYARINNGTNASYNLFTSAGAAATSIGSASGNIAAGEDPRTLSVTLRHAF